MYAGMAGGPAPPAVRSGGVHPGEGPRPLRDRVPTHPAKITAEPMTGEHQDSAAPMAVYTAV